MRREPGYKRPAARPAETRACEPARASERAQAEGGHQERPAWDAERAQDLGREVVPARGEGGEEARVGGGVLAEAVRRLGRRAPQQHGAAVVEGMGETRRTVQTRR